MSGQPDAGDPNGRGRDRGGRPDPVSLASDIWNDVQRWFIRSSAKSMRREIGGQVRKTLGGGRTDNSDVWNAATTEVPPAAGEAPECQWCPICRAARRMRETNPSLSGQLSGASDAVASAVQDAIKAFDSILARTPGHGGERPGSPPGGEAPGGERHDVRQPGGHEHDTGPNGADAGTDGRQDGPGHGPGDRG